MLGKGIVVLLFFSLCLSSSVNAAVKGACSNCHTMHNSQDGEPVKSSGPNKFLLDPEDSASPCVGCHSSDTNITIYQLGSVSVPVVLCGSEPTYPPDGSASSVLAGGNFYWLVNGNGDYDRNTLGHNVISIPNVDPDPNTAEGPPGGFSSSDVNSCGYCHGKGQLGDCTSCHVPKHHNIDHPDGVYTNIVDEDGGFYRFLGRQKDNEALPPTVYNNISSFHNNGGVRGIENQYWEQNPSASSHNEYAGETDHSGTLSGGYDSISDWCGGCHGDFHYYTNGSAVGSGSPWLRHPTDWAIPNSGEYANAYGDSHVYNPLAPVARPEITDSGTFTGSPGTVRIGTDQVQCLSCHRPHGSPYPDMLRWDPNSCQAGSSNSTCGCFLCHTQKDGD